MKDKSRLVLFAALVLLFVVLSRVNISMAFGHSHFLLGGLRHVLPFILIGAALWFFSCGRGCCRSRHQTGGDVEEDEASS